MDRVAVLYSDHMSCDHTHDSIIRVQCYIYKVGVYNMGTHIIIYIYIDRVSAIFICHY